MQRFEAKGLLFDLRPHSSDQQAIAEVVLKNVYQRRDFQIEAGEQWLDLGANVGAFSCLAMSKGASIEAYEPEPENARMTIHNLEINGYTAVIHEKAVVADNVAQDHLNFYLSEHPWRHGLYKKRNRGHIVVPIVHISSILEGINAIKMDIEGAEIDILFTLNDFKEVRKLVFEYHFDINNSIPLFLEIAARLKRVFTTVKHCKFQAGATEYNYFPPATLVFCQR